ncbi:PREDICTED: uncharacterized protein LOC104799801 [Tarenaya hassleriana]|uniref:uncharacterized protein LOC104799801 n=1 Tax=Tarenaya hassleriana TaxID=28532 RepID=UPI00053C4200|nr:PREDICTED: uncharacterized protein LOC104799801 [Tarenaya hassleriana]XP_010520754.1 PREDICTED: uncharacterized protein LOC104799801 [Tarenaya hassleriana]
MEDNPNRAEAERLLGIAEKLLESHDLNGSKEFAILAQELEPLLDGSDQILAVVDVLLAAENRVGNHPDWYGILQIDPQRSSSDIDLIKKQYRRLALLLHPDKNRLPYADQAFRFVADAWHVLSNAPKKSQFDSELNLFFTKVDLNHRETEKSPPWRKSGGVNERMATFWTTCPYCYGLYEYPGVYEECCVRCQNCRRAFHAAKIAQLPPLVPGRDEYYCCWGFFPMGFMSAKEASGASMADTSKFPNWMPPVFPTVHHPAAVNGFAAAAAPGGPSDVAKRGNEAVNVPAAAADGVPKKRGRPRKNPLP